jgi:hypothetical protein
MSSEEPRLSVEDAVLLREMVSSMKDEQVWRTLEDLANREIELLENPSIGGDPELRQASLWNAAAMISAAERFVTQVREEIDLPDAVNVLGAGAVICPLSGSINPDDLAILDDNISHEITIHLPEETD